MLSHVDCAGELRAQGKAGVGEMDGEGARARDCTTELGECMSASTT
jgi:hypothetical protein